MERAALYLRLSEEDRDLAPGERSRSIRNQADLLRAYAAAHGYAVEALYTDEDYAGTDRDRPAFRRLIRDARARRFTLILVKSQSRFTRDMEEAERYLHRQFPEWGVRLVCVVEGTDSRNGADHKAGQLNGLVNQWYLEELSANVRTTLQTKRQAGQYLGALAPYGYRKDPEDRHHLVPDPETAPTVQRIFSLCLAGYGGARIALILNAEGVLSPGACRHCRNDREAAAPPLQWSSASVYNILHNPLYTGDMVQGRSRTAGWKGRDRRPCPPAQWVTVDHTHTPLVSPETFAQAQQLLGRRCPAGLFVPKRRPLAHKVRCGGCGGGMMVTGSGNRWQMRCLRNRRDPRVCTPNRIPVGDLEAAVLGRLQLHLQQLLERPQLAQFVRQHDPTAARWCQARHRLERERARLERQLQALYLQQAAGALSPAVLDRQVRETVQALEALSGRQKLPAPTPPSAEESLCRLLPPPGTAPLPRALVRALVEAVTVWPEGPPGSGARVIEIHWNF